MKPQAIAFSLFGTVVSTLPLGCTETELQSRGYPAPLEEAFNPNAGGWSAGLATALGSCRPPPPPYSRELAAGNQVASPPPGP